VEAAWGYLLCGLDISSECELRVQFEFSRMLNGVIQNCMHLINNTIIPAISLPLSVDYDLLAVGLPWGPEVERTLTLGVTH
jgi:hypothetical protein